MSYGGDSAVGTTIKLEEFEKLPNGLIIAGVISNSIDGIAVPQYKEDELLLYRVIKYSNLDWRVLVSKWDINYTLIDNIHRSPDDEDCESITEYLSARRVFNCSKQVMTLLI